MASSCKLRRDNPSVLIKIRDLNKKSTECLCLLCFYFCAADKEFQNDFAKQSLTKTAVHDKELVSSTLQNCTCSKAAHKDILIKAMGFIEGMTKRCEEHKAMKRTKKIKESREPSDHVELGSQFSLVQAWEIALINEILGTKDGDKYLLELYPPHLEFFQRLNKTQSYLESKSFKWSSVPSESILRQADFLSNAGKWAAIRTPRQDVLPLINCVTLKYINLVCNYTVKTVGKETHYDESQYFYSKLLKFYKEAYIHKRLSRVEPMEILGLERMTPLSRIELREINKAEFERHFPGARPNSASESNGRRPSGDTFNPAEFCKKCIDEFIIDFSFGSVSLAYRADIYAVEIAAILFRYGVLDLKTATGINELLYEKIENLKTQEEVLEN